MEVDNEQWLDLLRAIERLCIKINEPLSENQKAVISGAVAFHSGLGQKK